MHLLTAIVLPHIISPTLFATLAGVRAPSFLPQSLNSELFESHFGVWIACIVIGYIATKLGQMRRQRNLLQAGFVIVILTMFWMLAAYVVDTPAERLHNVHLRLLTAAQHKDTAALRAMLEPGFEFGTIDRDGLIRAVDESLKTFTIKSNTVRLYAATVDGPAAETQINVLSELQGSAAGIYVTKWHLAWHDHADDWRLERIIDPWFLNDQEMHATSGFPKAP